MLTWLPQGRKCSGKKNSSRSGKSQGISLQVGKFYGHIIIILFMKLNSKLIVGFQKSRSFLHVIVKELHCINSCTLHVSCWKHKLINGWRGSGCEGSTEHWVHYELSGLICAIVNSVDQGNFTVFRKNSEEKIPETPGCSNHVKVPLWSTLLLRIAEFRLYLVMTWDEFKSKILLILRILKKLQCKWRFEVKNKIITSQQKELLYTMQCIISKHGWLIYSKC